MARLAGTVIAALMCTAVEAASDPARGRIGGSTSGSGSSGMTQQEMYRGSRIIGAPVHDANDRKIGEVRDLLLDSARGEVAYAVLGFGTGRKLHAVPWRALEPSETGRHYILNADREVVSQAPGFDMGDWPDTASQRWSEEVDRYWNRMVGRGPFPRDADDTASGSSAGNGAANGSSGAGSKPGSGSAGRR